jgi:4-amino-4-deoxy-L-arabinose transferase-like glycosyltransferase
MHTIDPTSRNRWSWPLALFAITLLALVLRVYYVRTAVVDHPIRGDAAQYYAYAVNLTEHAVFSKDTPGAATITPDYYRDPGYPLFLSAWMKALGWADAWYAAVLLSQALLGALTVTLAVQLGRYWLAPEWAIGAGLLMAVWPHSIAINGYLLTETLFGFLCVLGMLLCARACRRENPWWAVAAGLVLGAAALTNAVLLPFGILLAGLLAWRKLASRKICVALLAGALVLPGAWAIRNMQVSSTVAGNSSKDRALFTFVVGAWPNYGAAWRASISGDAAQKAKADVTLQTVNVEYAALQASPMQGAKMILQRFSEHPWRYAVWYLFEKPHELWNWDIQIGQGDIYVYPTTNAPFQVNPVWIALAAICHVLNLLLLLLALASLYFAWTKRHWMDGWDKQGSRTALVGVICLLVFATLVYTVLQAEPRYSIAFRPFEILLAITTLTGITMWWQECRHANASPHAGEPLDTA